MISDMGTKLSRSVFVLYEIYTPPEAKRYGLFSLASFYE
jgi:hypothetical protein